MHLYFFIRFYREVRMKNPNGFGTVYKMSGKRRKKWRAVKTIGWENNKQMRITIGYYETRAEAEKVIANYIYNPNAKLKLKDVYEMWSKKHFEKIGDKRMITIASRYKFHISKIEELCISEINLKILQEFIDGLELSSGTIVDIKTILNMIFEYALKNDFIAKNPVKFIELKKYKKVFDKKPFTQEEIDILWDNLEVKYVDIILILIYTGMRISELINLETEDIDLERKTIFIKKSKTESGIRHIPIYEKIYPIIINKMRASNKYFITLSSGKRMTYSQYRTAFKKVFKSLKIYEHTPHECRHTTATLLSNVGANPISIAKIMGHTDYNGITAKVYTHKNEAELEKAINLLI
jgi:integrase